MTVEERLQNLMRCICQTKEEEIDGVAWDLQMINLAEMAARGTDIATLYPAIQQYLNNSPDCYEEFRALVAMLKAEIELGEDS
ncbi:MAG: hypothetical protein F9K27_08375 [Anaerolineae bacterium]|nr:MAG: hypothetical protein F9K27_08375 [Anaerolineae bacterium]